MQIATRGTYSCKHKFLQHTETITYRKGILKTSKGDYINPTTFDDFWKVVEKVKVGAGNYDILWKVGAKEERITLRCPYPVAVTKMNELKRTTHKSGELKIVKSN